MFFRQLIYNRWMWWRNLLSFNGMQKHRFSPASAQLSFQLIIIVCHNILQMHSHYNTSTESNEDDDYGETKWKRVDTPNGVLITLSLICGAFSPQMNVSWIAYLSGFCAASHIVSIYHFTAFVTTVERKLRHCWHGCAVQQQMFIRRFVVEALGLALEDNVATSNW